MENKCKKVAKYICGGYSCKYYKEYRHKDEIGGYMAGNWCQYRTMYGDGECRNEKAIKNCNNKNV